MVDANHHMKDGDQDEKYTADLDETICSLHVYTAFRLAINCSYVSRPGIALRLSAMSAS